MARSSAHSLAFLACPSVARPVSMTLATAFVLLSTPAHAEPAEAPAKVTVRSEDTQ